mgnify:CR=1 FL=1
MVYDYWHWTDVVSVQERKNFIHSFMNDKIGEEKKELQMFKEMSEDDIVDKDNQDKKISIQEAQFYLHKTDWYAFRKADTGKEIPEDIKIKREEARQTISNLE